MQINTTSAPNQGNTRNHVSNAVYRRGQLIPLEPFDRNIRFCNKSTPTPDSKCLFIAASLMSITAAIRVVDAANFISLKLYWLDLSPRGLANCSPAQHEALRTASGLCLGRDGPGCSFLFLVLEGGCTISLQNKHPFCYPHSLQCRSSLTHEYMNCFQRVTWTYFTSVIVLVQP